MKNKSLSYIILIIGFILIAFNSRTAITSIIPVIGSIQEEFSLSNGMIGLLTTIPLFCFAVLSPLIPKLSNRLGIEKALIWGMFIILIGISLRSAGLMLTLFIGTILIGIGITVPNVLLPGIIKQRFASQLGLFTGIYTISMGISGSISSGLSAPLAYSFGWGWKNSLLIWGLVIIVAILIWLPQLKASQNTSTHLVNDQGTKDTSIWRSLVAWQVTFYMSLQSIVFFIALAWLPSILMSRGLDIAQAGWYLSIMLLCGIPGMFLSSIIANKLPQQKGLSFIIGVIVLIGLFGLFSSSKLILLLATILIGLGNGSGMGLVFTLIGIRTATVSQATALSGMAQSVGYLFSSLGPVMMGLIFDGTGNWNIPIILLICMSLSMLVVGQKAGENKLTHQTNNNPELLMPKHSV